MNTLCWFSSCINEMKFNLLDKLHYTPWEPIVHLFVCYKHYFSPRLYTHFEIKSHQIVVNVERSIYFLLTPTIHLCWLYFIMLIWWTKKAYKSNFHCQKTFIWFGLASKLKLCRFLKSILCKFFSDYLG